MYKAAEESLARVPLFSGLDPSVRGELAERLQRVHLHRGEILFREGDTGPALFLIESGAVRVLAQQGTQEVCRLGPGEHVGEMSLIDEAPRSATVVARCDTSLWRLSRDDFAALTQAHPDIHRQIAVALVRRLRDTTARETRQHSVTVVVLIDARPAGPAADDLPGTLVAALREITSRRIALIHLGDTSEATAVRPLGGATCIHEPESLSAHLDGLLEDHGHALLLIDGLQPDEKLLRAAFGRADLALVFTTMDPQSVATARQAIEMLDRMAIPAAPPIELALDRRAERSRPPFRPVDALAAGRPIHTIAHTPGYTRLGAPDFDGVGRLARRIARRRVGLALGGGGARAFAHIGVLAVLEKAGIPVDVLAGTSGGAIVAGLAARDWDSRRIADFLLARWTRRGVVDWRIIPWVSLLSGRKLEQIGRDAGEGLTLQELNRPVVVVATDLVTGEEVRLSRGDGWTAVRASLTVPGIFPPVRVGDRYLVDGGALDNLPAAAAREAGADIVIGVNVSPPLEPAFLPPPEPKHPQGFMERLLAWRFRGGVPLFRIIYRTITVQGQALRSRQGSPDITLTPNVAAYDMFEFGDLRPIIAAGRTETESRIAEIRRVAIAKP